VSAETNSVLTGRSEDRTGAASTVSELFLADAYPGSPVLYTKTQEGKQVLLAELIEHDVPAGRSGRQRR
jgi:hypothetical protein